MKSLFFAIVIWCSSSLFGQSSGQLEYNLYNVPEFNYKVTPIKDKVVEGVKEVNYTIVNPKRENKVHYNKKFNENGEMTSLKKTYKDKDILMYTLDFDSINHLKVHKIYKEKTGKLKSESIHIMDEKGISIERIIMDGKGKIQVRRTWIYNEFGNLINSKIYKTGGEKVFKEWYYEYYDGKTKSKSYVIDGKGKVLATWTFDCKEEGEQVDIKKDVTQVCYFDEVTDKYLIEVKQNFNSKGQSRKSVWKYNKSDSSLAESANYDQKDRLKYMTKYNGDFKSETFFASYRNNGKERFKRETSYDSDGKLVEVKSYWKGKLKSVTKRYYDRNERLQNVEKYKRNGDELIEQISIKYVM